MIDVTSESPLTLREATRLPFLKRNGRKPHLATLYRWAERGVRGVKLDTVQVGGSRCTSTAAVLRFIARLSDPALPPSHRTPDQRQRQCEQARRELEAEGIA